MNYGEFLKDVREKRKISRYRLSRLSGVQESTIKHWEDGKAEPTIRNFNKVLSALGFQLFFFNSFSADQEGGIHELENHVKHNQRHREE